MTITSVESHSASASVNLHSASDIPIDQTPFSDTTRQAWLNEERVGVTPLRKNSPELSSLADAAPRSPEFLQPTEMSISTARLNEIEGSDPEKGFQSQGIPTSPSSVQSSSFQENGSNSNSSLFSSLLKYLRKMGIGDDVSQFENDLYLALERMTANLPQFRRIVETLHQAFQSCGISRKERKELTRLTLELMNKIDRVSIEKLANTKWATKLFFSVLSVSLCILPLLTAKKNNDLQYLSLLIAGYAKTMLMLLGFWFSKTADAAAFLNYMNQRHTPYLVPTLPYALSAYVEQVKNFEVEHPLTFIAMAALFVGAIFFVSCVPHLVTGLIRRICNWIKEYLDSSQSAETNVTAAALTEQLKEEIRGLANAIETQCGEMKKRRREFEGDGNQLSDVLSTQVSDIDDATINLNNTLKKLLGGESAGSIFDTATRNNDDFSKKMALTILATILCFGCAATYYDEPVGLIDLVADAFLAIFEMTKTTLNPAETSQRAAEKFASYSGLALLLLPFGIINKIPATHFTDNVVGFVVGTLLLTFGNLTLPRPTAEFLSQSILNLIDKVKTSRGEFAENSTEHGTEMTRDSSFAEYRAA